MSRQLTVESTRRHLNPRQADTVQKILAAARAELLDTGFETLTVRAVAARAGVAPATAYTYFSSKQHLVVEMFWRSLNDRPRTESTAKTPRARVNAIFADLADFLAAEQAVSAAVTAAMLSAEPEVKRVRFLIGTEINERIADAAGDAVTPAMLDLLGLAWSGAMLQAGMGHSDYAQMSARLRAATKLIIKG